MMNIVYPSVNQLNRITIFLSWQRRKEIKIDIYLPAQLNGTALQELTIVSWVDFRFNVMGPLHSLALNRDEPIVFICTVSYTSCS